MRALKAVWLFCLLASKQLVSIAVDLYGIIFSEQQSRLLITIGNTEVLTESTDRAEDFTGSSALDLMCSTSTAFTTGEAASGLTCLQIDEGYGRVDGSTSRA